MWEAIVDPAYGPRPHYDPAETRTWQVRLLVLSVGTDTLLGRCACKVFTVL